MSDPIRVDTDTMRFAAEQPESYNLPAILMDAADQLDEAHQIEQASAEQRQSLDAQCAHLERTIDEHIRGQGRRGLREQIAHLADERNAMRTYAEAARKALEAANADCGTMANDLTSCIALLKRLRAWDMMDSAADGTYWRREIDATLAKDVEPPLDTPPIGHAIVPIEDACEAWVRSRPASWEANAGSILAIFAAGAAWRENSLVQLVPWVPTTAMLEAAFAVRQEAEGLQRPLSSVKLWQAMLAATGCAYEPPSVPSQGPQEADRG